ncbi:putative cyclin-A3-1 isoform X2 [Cryptosporidium felis]|nr:putative cyclin-A3-1 isoform X2 [Cryptosporidium felis]
MNPRYGKKRKLKNQQSNNLEGIQSNQFSELTSGKKKKSDGRIEIGDSPILNKEETYYQRKLLESGLNHICRVIVLDWLVGVHRKFQFRPATIHIGIALFDRFIRFNKKDGLISCDNLQLIGATCLHIASKYEDVNPAVLLDYCIMSNSEFNPRDMINMEAEILNTLQFKVVDSRTIIDYLDSFFEPGSNGINKKKLPRHFYSCALYISELSLLHQAMIFSNPKILSVSILLLLCILFEKDETGGEYFPIVRELKYILKKFSKAQNIVKNVRVCIKALIGIIKEQFFLELEIKDDLEKFVQKSNVNEGLPFIHLKDLTSKWRNAYSSLHSRISSLNSKSEKEHAN